MSFKGILLKAGVDTDGVYVSFKNGFGLNMHDVQILRSRIATGAVAGSYLTVDATTFWWEEGMELKYNVTDWDDSTVSGYSSGTVGSGYLNAFTGLKVHTQTSESASKTLQGIDSDCRVNNVDAGAVSSIKAHVYIKGSTAKTVASAFGGESEVEVANGSGALTITTSLIAHEFRMRTSTAVAGANLLKCHGAVIKCGDTDGQTVTVGTGLLIENYASGGGTVTWTTGLKITDCITGIDLSGVAGAGSNIILGGYGRISTSTIAGAALDIDASCVQAQGVELRYTISSWTGIGSNYYGMYLRTQTGVDSASKELNGLEVYATAAHNCGQLRGISSFAYVKGSDAKTVGPIYGVSAELTYDGSQAAQTVTTEAMPLRCKISSGNVTGAQALKIHGIQLYSFSMDGASVTYGNAIEIKDGTETGTTTWTTGINLAANCTTGISFSATTISTALSVPANTVMPKFLGVGTWNNWVEWDQVDEFMELLVETTDKNGTKPMVRFRLAGDADEAAVSGRLCALQLQTYNQSTNNIYNMTTLEIQSGIKGDATLESGGKFCGIEICLEDLGSVFTGTGDVYWIEMRGQFFNNSSNLSANSAFIYVNNDNNLPSNVNSFVRFADRKSITEYAGAVDYLFDFSDATSGYPCTTRESGAATTIKATIKIIKPDGSDGYINVYGSDGS